MDNLRRPGLAWVTGASSGIGRELALQLAARGWRVIASARDEEALARVAAEAEGPGAVVPLALDITDASAAARAVATIASEHGELDLAILNAGTHRPTPADAFDRETVAMLVATNLMGTVNCLAPLLPVFIKRRRGEIAVVASLTGYRGLPTASAYGATKAALINLCESLRPELELHDVSLRLVNPGFVETPLTQKNTFPMPFLISAKDGARMILKGLEGTRFEIAVPRRMAIAMKLLRLMPNWLYLAVARRITPRPGTTVQRD